MTTYSKYNIVYRLQKWMDSVPGQTFLNYAYSWGASIVILGTLFKLTHLPGANFFLFLGMGTEVFVFFISAFDRPFDKTTEGMELNLHPGEEKMAAGVVSDKVSKLSSVSAVSTTPIVSSISAAPINTELEMATNRYVEELKRLTETLSKVSEQSQKLTTDSEEMENLNRTLTGICKVYEIQLKSASSQIGTIDEINEQTRKMAAQIAELNKIYARMIEAMTAKMNV
ncbi:gliding motility-associated protein GldL [Xylanibacter ruminicola]|jgi:gliding motility-associated protein GldL|uniref:Gliding motility-associated protein GldL n=1 Tax=Xylanibacter ruminicola TaxID=839 RepID=A0A1H5WUE9_XYLRU|nr:MULTISPECIES: gliding motility protein GldL [Prevotellaceae]MCR5471057.1 gliding motility protein GldL [Prevotella sp.]SEG02860.1 gliding motility-associated protein GldL [Xylanibacter ruminicola]